MDNQQKPQEIVFQAIRTALANGELKPGMRLPSERKMAEQYGVSRGYVREALRTLETYGIIRTLPQSGSVIVGLDVTALDGLLSEILQLSGQDFSALAEVRCILEEHAVRLCAERRTESDIKLMEEALADYDKACLAGDEQRRQSADFHFHRCIAAGAKNVVLRQMFVLITPDIMTEFNRQQICFRVARDPQGEHHQILEAIRKQDGAQAALLMRGHLSGVAEFAAKLRGMKEDLVSK